MSQIWLHRVCGKCPSQYNNTADGISVVCSILSGMYYRTLMCGRWNAMLVAMTDGKAII